MIQPKKAVHYAYEHGDPSLPRLKDLVSDTPDPEKATILDYLRTNCIMTCPGVRRDEITPGMSIGVGNVFSDGIYLWNDVLTNYVDRYNIPLPKEFRDHVLNNHALRAEKHALLRLVDSVEIENEPQPGLRFQAVIHRVGRVLYQNGAEKAKIPAENAAPLIDPMTTELFCYDSGGQGEPTPEGYHWKLTFFQNRRIIRIIEGWPGEDSWRYYEFRKCVTYMEREIPFDLGSKCMPDIG